MELKPKYQRVVLKLSGEALAGYKGTGLDAEIITAISKEVKEIIDLGVQVAIVVGAGNIWRGVSGIEIGIERATSDYMGMLGTVINALALQDCLEAQGVDTRVLSAIEMRAVAEPYIRRRALRHLEKGRVVIFAAGTGNPYFTTDTCAALRAAEIEADVILMAKKVDGVYDADPILYPNARKYERLAYIEVLNQGLGVMDATATSLCMDNEIPIVVFSIVVRGNIKRVILGDIIGTHVKGDKK